MDIRNSPASDKSVSLKTEMRNHDFVETWKKQVGSEEAREISLHRILYCHEYTSMKWLTSHNSHPSMCSLYTHNMIPLMQVAYGNLACGHLTHAIHVVVHFHNKLRSYSLHTFPHTCTLLPTVFNRGARSWMWYLSIQSYTIIYIYIWVR